MNDKIKQIGSEIAKYLFGTYPKTYIESVFSGKLDVDDFVDQVILECIKYAYYSTSKKYSIRGYLKENNELSDDKRMALIRTINEWVIKYKKKELEYISSFGVDVSDNIIKVMKDIADKLEGHHLSQMHFFEMENIIELKLVKAIIKHRLMNVKKISNKGFKEIASQYDKFTLNLKIRSLENDEQMVFNSLAFFTIEWRYAFNFIYRCALEMDANGIRDSNMLFSKINMLLGLKRFISAYGCTITTDSRMVGYREGLIAEFIKSSEIEYQYREMLALVTEFKENVKINEKPIKEWFAENTDISDWASFFREYDVFKIMDSEKNWTNKSIRRMRDIYTVIFPENPENRSYNFEKEFDIILSKIKEDFQMDKLECYIEEYTNDVGMLCARLREKESNKRVEMYGGVFEWNHLLRFLSAAKENINRMPTIFDRNGVDIVAVRGIKQAEDEDTIEVKFDVIGAGYLFE